MNNPTTDTTPTSDPNAVRDIDTAVRVLNEALAADPAAIHALFHNQVPCNDRLADHSTIPVQRQHLLGSSRPQFFLTMLGVINGILSPITGKRVVSVWDDTDVRNPTLHGFDIFGETPKALPIVAQLQDVLTIVRPDEDPNLRSASYTEAALASYTEAALASGAVRGLNDVRLLIWHREPTEDEEQEVLPIIEAAHHLCVYYPSGSMRVYSGGAVNFTQHPAP